MLELKKVYLSPISDYQDKLCRFFAEASVSTNEDEYAKRNQNDKTKLKLDIYQGKKAEFMIFNYLLKKGKKPSIPDIMIYEKEYKSFDSDMRINDSHLHIKSCLDDNGFPNSWLFQPYDKLTITPDDKEFIALVVLSNENSYFYMAKAESFTGMYKDPLKKTLNKKVIYERDIKAVEPIDTLEHSH